MSEKYIKIVTILYNRRPEYARRPIVLWAQFKTRARQKGTDLMEKVSAIRRKRPLETSPLFVRIRGTFCRLRVAKSFNRADFCTYFYTAKPLFASLSIVSMLYIVT